MNASWIRYLPRLLRCHVDGRYGLQAIMGNTFWLFLDKVLRIAIGIIVGAWVARYLGPSRYGELAYIIAYVTFFQAMGRLGMDSIVVRDIARDPVAANEILGINFRCRLFAGFILWMAAILFMWLLRTEDQTALLLTAVLASTVFFQSAETVDLWFQSQSQSKRTVLAKSLGYLGGNGLKVIFMLVQAPLVFFASAWLLETVLTSLALYLAYLKYSAHGAWCWQIQRAKLLLQESWHYLLSSLAIIVYMRIDQIMLREMIGEKEVGVFSAALMPSEASYFIASALMISIAPTISRKKKESETAYLNTLKTFFSIMWFMSITIAVAVSLSSSFIVNLFYGLAYQSSITVLAIHIFSVIPVFLGVSSGLWLTNEKRGDLAVKQTLLGAGITILMNLYLIPIYGATGAAMSSVVSYFVSAILANSVFAWPLFKLQISSLFWMPKVHAQ